MNGGEIRQNFEDTCARERATERGIFLYISLKNALSDEYMSKYLLSATKFVSTKKWGEGG